MEAGGSAVDTDRVAAAGELGDGQFKLVEAGADGKGAGAKHLDDGVDFTLGDVGAGEGDGWGHRIALHVSTHGGLTEDHMCMPPATTAAWAKFPSMRSHPALMWRGASFPVPGYTRRSLDLDRPNLDAREKYRRQKKNNAHFLRALKFL